MVASAILSSIMSNVPVTAMFAGLAAGMLEKMGKEKALYFGKTVMIAIPFATMIGGSMTPAGSSINVLALDLLEKYSGIRVGFVTWMAYGIPVAMVILPLCWYILVKIFKPENVDQHIVDSFLYNKKIPEKFTVREIRVLGIITLMVTLWILSTWVPFLNTTVVAVAGLILFFMPGMEIFSWKQFTDGVSWDTVMMIGGLLSIGAAAIEANLGQWLLDLFLNYLLQLNLVTLLIFMGVFIALLHLPMPIAPAIVAVAAGPLYGLALQMGINPVLLIIPLAIFASCCMLVPLDAVPLITYSHGYYNMKDMFVAGALTTLLWTVLLSIWVPVIGDLVKI
jgi:sodium-dependent dicarboxylate transporter 2/3/5